MGNLVGGRAGPLPKGLVQIRVVTANTTCWASCRAWLQATTAEELPHLLLIQEHKLRTQEAIDDASSFGHRLGYSSIWSVAATGPAGQAAGGTAIFAIRQLGLCA